MMMFSVAMQRSPDVDQALYFSIISRGFPNPTVHPDNFLVSIAATVGFILESNNEGLRILSNRYGKLHELKQQ